MDIHPWEAPEQRGTPAPPPGRWQRCWKELCQACISLSVVGMLFAAACFCIGLSFELRGLGPLARLFAVIFAQALLIVGVAGGVIGGIGWALSPREPGERAD